MNCLKYEWYVPCVPCTCRTLRLIYICLLSYDMEFDMLCCNYEICQVMEYPVDMLCYENIIPCYILHHVTS